MVQNTFDAGIFLTLLTIGFICLLSHKKIGGISLIGSSVSFFIIGLLIITGYDVSSFTSNVDNTGSVVNSTAYFIGNGLQPTGTGQLVLGIIMMLLATISGVLFLHSMIKGQFFPSD